MQRPSATSWLSFVRSAFVFSSFLLTTTHCALEERRDSLDTTATSAEGLTESSGRDCTDKVECTVSPSRRASVYRDGLVYRVDISGVFTGDFDNSFFTGVAENFGVLSSTAEWVIEEIDRRGVDASNVSVRGHSLGAIDAMSVVLYGRASHALIFAVPGDPLFWFSSQLSLFHGPEHVHVDVIQGDHDPLVVGTVINTWALDSRISLRWVKSPYSGPVNAKNHYRAGYCLVAPETCFQ